MELTYTQYELVFNILSLSCAAFFAATLFFFAGLSKVSNKYKIAVIVTGLVTFIAGYHYLRMFNSWGDAYTVIDGTVTATGAAFNVTYRYVDWLLTVPLLLIELILVMSLTPAEKVSKAAMLGSAAALMIVLGYVGEVSEGIDSTRLTWGSLSMIPFLYIVYSLFVGLSESITKHDRSVQELINVARWILVLSWCFYPVVYFAPYVMFLDSAEAQTIIEVGYTIADLVAKVVFGVVIFAIAVRKSQIEQTR